MKRSPMPPRTTPLRRTTGDAKLSVPVLRKRHCENPGCRALFRPEREGQRACGLVCAPIVGRQDRIKDDKAKARAAAKKDKEKLQAMKPYRELIAEAQVPFNAFIRERDAHLPCVSCGATNPPMTPGGQWDAGHYLGRGAYPELRFNEANCHKQCKSCNAGGKFSAKAKTVAAAYRVELLARVGEETVAFLEGPHPQAKWTREELVGIKTKYARLARELKKGKES